MAIAREQLELRRLLTGSDRERPQLIPLLQAAQDRLGYLPEEAVDAIARHLGLSSNDVYGVASFYAQFRFQAPARHVVKVCQGTACHVRGSGLILDQIARELGIGAGETTPDGEFAIERVACVGACAMAPVVVIDGDVHGGVSPRSADVLLREAREGLREPSGREATEPDRPAIVARPGVRRRRLSSTAALGRLQLRLRRERARQSRQVVVCGGPGCLAAGSMRSASALGHALREEGLDGEVGLKVSGCLGLCQQAPLVVVEPDDLMYCRVGRRNPERDAAELVRDTFRGGKPVERLLYRDETTKQRIPLRSEIPFYARQTRIVLDNVGKIDPTSLDDYLAEDGYTALATVLTLDPGQVIAAIEASGLRGRGGAGFPTGRKWRICRDAPDASMHYVICNADEGDPGAFMDRAIIEGDPHSVLEGMIIGAYAMARGVGPVEGYVYIRAEYPLAVRTLERAIEQAERYGLLGERILGSDFSFHVKIKQGAGAFVCGEETALLASLEGRRGMPMPRPPYPAHHGLFGKPTNINNVETWANVPRIVRRGADWYAAIGTEGSKGTKVFSLVGKIRNSGLIEVPMGTTLRTIVEEIGGGVGAGRSFKAVQTGGPSGGCISAEHLDTPVDYDNLQRLGSIMGSGGMVVMDDRSCMVDVARYFLRFTENESCGKCVPCRVGTQHLLRTLEAIAEGRSEPEDLRRLAELGEAVSRGSLCGLGQTAPNPVKTTLAAFTDEYRAHVHERRCPAGVCADLITFCIDAERCEGCAACVRACPVDAIHGDKKQPHEIDLAACIRCGSCREACRFEAVVVQ